MDERLIGGVVLALVALVSINGITLGDSLDLVVENQTGMDLEALYLAPYPAESWGENRLTGEVLKDGQARRLILEDIHGGYWDLMIPQIEPEPVIWRKLNVRVLLRIVFIYDGDELQIEYE